MASLDGACTGATADASGNDNDLENRSANQEQQQCDQENDRDKIVAELTRANGILKANISTLYRTARAEIARKNERIAELQANLDDLLFKRMNRAGQSRDLSDDNRLSAVLGETSGRSSGTESGPLHRT